MVRSRKARAANPAELGLSTQIVFSSCRFLSVKLDCHDGQGGIATIRLPVNLYEDLVRICSANRIRMHGESLGRFGCGPIAQLHDLADFQSMGGRIMWPLLGRDPFTLLSKHCQLPLKHLAVPRGRVPSRGEAYDRRGMRNQTYPREHVTLSDGDGDRINQMQDR